MSHLKRRGYYVRGVDLEPPRFSATEADEFQLLDLREKENCLTAALGMDDVYALAADMGGVGYLSSNHARVMRDNLLIDLHTLEAARIQRVRRFFYASSACVYPEYRQTETAVVPLREEDVYPAQPQDGYGWEKLVAERMCLDYQREHGLEVRIARFHNIYGSHGTWDGGREKAPAALCRKIAVAKLSGSRMLEIWGDGGQTRSFCHIDDCIAGIERLMQSVGPSH